MPDDQAIEVIRRWERLKGDRGTTEVHWQQVADYMLPDRNDYIVERTPGVKRMQRIFDSTPLLALEQAASGIHSLLTSPSLQWFALRCEDDRLNANQRVRAWLDDTSRRMYTIFSGPKHNFASQSHELYLDLMSIGTGVMAELESERSGLLFSTRHLKECVIEENEEDRIDGLTRSWEYTAKQAVEAWGNAAGESAVKAYQDRPDRKFRFMHSVRPRRRRDAQRRDALHKPFESIYVAVADKTIIRAGGFDEFPYHVPRFSKLTGEIYGRGPGMTALPDVKMLNEMMKTVLKAAQKIVDPPLNVPDDGFITPIKTVPGAFNYYRAGSKDRIEPIKTEGNVQLGIEMVNALRQVIMQIFFGDLLRMPTDPRDPASAGKGVTATFTLQQRDEMMRIMSPVLARLQSEFLAPLIDRTFSIMWRRSVKRQFGPGSMLLPPPPELSGIPLRVDYVSPLAVAQRSSELDVMGRLLDLATRIGQVDQTVGQVIDGEAMLRKAANDMNAPAASLKTPEAVAAARQQAADAQAQLNAHGSIAALAGAAKDGSAAVKNLAGVAGLVGAANQAGGASSQEAA